MIGTRLAHYEITAHLGSGGMGEVYRATDVKLGRGVAIKMLPAAFVVDGERLARFRREAQMLASLNHPHIAHIYGLEESGGMHCIVMELVEGETLQSLVRHGAVPFDDALRIAKQIVEALEAAHERGIIHRDLKPGNVMVSNDGSVKVLDFGLAKSDARRGPEVALSNSPTMAIVSGTVPGVILGTAAYMSPEQARGRAVDGRADIWAFGAVFYEMLTGRRAFPGEDLTDTLAAVVKLEPDWKAIGPHVPARVSQLIRLCLRKDLRQRLQNMGDVRLALDGAFETRAPDAPGRGTSMRFVWATLAAGLATGGLLGAASAWTWMAPRAPSPAPSARVTVMTPANRPIAVTGFPSRALAISTDGSQLVYVGANLDMADQRGDRTQLQLRALDSLDVQDLPGTAGARQPFFSPNGQWVGFFTANELKKVSLAGGSPLTLVSDINGAESGFAVWTRNDVIIFGALTGGLRSVSAEGGAVRELTTPDTTRGESLHYLPSLVPDERAVLFSVGHRDPSKRRIDAVMLDSGQQRTVLDNARMATALDSGHLLFQRDETILVAPFDFDALDVTGPAVPLREDIRRDSFASPIPIAELVASSNGILAYLPAVDSSGVLGLVSRQGVFEALEVARANFRVPVASPDGQSIAYIAGEGEDSAVRVYDRTRGRTIALTRMELSEGVAWRDNTSLSVASRTRPGVFLHTLDGSSTLLVPQPPAGAFIRNMSWSSDGNRLAYTLQTGLLHDIWVLRMEQPDKPRPFHQRPGSEHSPRFSPGGQWLAYVSDESGPAEVYVRRYPDGPALLASASGGTGPAWSRDGRELFFQGTVDGVWKMMAVTVTLDGASLRLGTPQPLFDLRTTQPTGEVVQYGLSNNIAGGYDVLPDGRFLMHRSTEPAAARELILVQNWFDELRRTMPER